MLFATKKDKNGKIHKSKKMSEGECKFPFKYNRKMQNECVKGKNGDWCATEIDSDRKMLKYGYCQQKIDAENLELNIEKKNDNKINKVNNNLKQNEIYGDLIDNTGKKNNSKKLKEGYCVFPFKYYGKMRNECINSKKGYWCATEIDEESKPIKYGYCKSVKKNTFVTLKK